MSKATTEAKATAGIKRQRLGTHIRSSTEPAPKRQCTDSSPNAVKSKGHGNTEVTSKEKKGHAKATENSEKPQARR
jgi:hypothetical protein